MDHARLQGLLTKVSDIGRISESEARQIVSEIYQDGIVSRQEADALFDLNDRLDGADPLWDERFREAIKDFLLTVEAPIGWIDNDECDWLMSRIIRDGEVRLETEIDLLLDVLRYAEGAPEQLGRFAMKVTCDHARKDGKITARDVERIRRALYAGAGDGANWVTREEAGALFALNDACAHAKNDPEWNDLFARAIANHLLAAAHPDPETEAEALAREAWLTRESGGVAAIFAAAASSLTDGTWFEKVTYNPERARKARHAAKLAALNAAERVDPSEEDWLMKRLGWDKTVSSAERALIDFLKKEAPGFTHGIVIAA